MKIYLAGPLFTLAERLFNAELASALQGMGYDVWLPQEREPRELSSTAIFHKDVEGLDWADMIVANMDGPDPDSGTAWECAYAYGNHKLVLAYRTDFRGVGEGGLCGYNIMLWESATIRLQLPCLSPAFKSVETIAEMIDEQLKQVNHP